MLIAPGIGQFAARINSAKPTPTSRLINDVPFIFRPPFILKCEFSLKPHADIKAQQIKIPIQFVETLVLVTCGHQECGPLRSGLEKLGVQCNTNVVVLKLVETSYRDIVFERNDEVNERGI